MFENATLGELADAKLVLENAGSVVKEIGMDPRSLRPELGDPKPGCYVGTVQRFTAHSQVPLEALDQAVKSVAWLPPPLPLGWISGWMEGRAWAVVAASKGQPGYAAERYAFRSLKTRKRRPLKVFNKAIELVDAEIAKRPVTVPAEWAQERELVG